MGVAPIVELVECLTPVHKVAVSAVRVSSEIRAEWRDLWPTFPVSCGVLVASCPGGLEITTSSGCSGSSPRSALIKTCANKKIGKKWKEQKTILKYDDLPEERRRCIGRCIGRCRDARRTLEKEDQSRV